MGEKRVIGIIPARFGSTRLPGKPLLPIRGKTLLQRTFENASCAIGLSELWVATDDTRIAAHVSQFGGRVVMTSPHCLSGTDRLAEVLSLHPELEQYDAIVNIQGDEPCVNPHDITAAVDALYQDVEVQMTTLVTPLRTQAEIENPSYVKCVVTLNRRALYFSRAPIPGNKQGKANPAGGYYRHLGLYVYRPLFLRHYVSLPATPLQLEEDLEQLKVLEHGYQIGIVVTEQAGVSVDTAEDLHQLEKWLCIQNTSLSPAVSAPLLERD